MKFFEGVDVLVDWLLGTGSNRPKLTRDLLSMAGCTWQPEFGAWMVESTPNRPYGAYAHDLLRYELMDQRV